MRMKVPCLAFALAQGLSGNPAGAAERTEIGSFTPQDYTAVLTGEYRNSPVQIQGYFTKPAQGAKFPAVVIVPDSGADAAWLHTNIAKPLNDAGIATLVIDSYFGRGITEVATDQGKVPMAASVMDGFAALQALAQRSDIEPTRIGITGFSRGGVVAMFSAEQRLQQAVHPQGPGFAAHLPFYPGCSTQWMNPRPSAAPMKFLLAEKDDYTPAANCVRYADRLVALGGAVSVKVYPNAHHGWMADAGMRTSSQAQTFGNCDLQIEDSGQIKDMKSGATTKDGWRNFVGKVVQSCGSRGATIGAQPEGRAAAVADMVAFFTANLLRPRN